MIFSYLIFFILCCAAVYVAGEWVITGLSRIAKFLGIKEFAVAFVVMAFAGSLPNLALGIMSVINGIPELSFGDVVGGNVIDLTLTIALATLISKNGIPAKGDTIQLTSLFTIIAAILPLVMLVDGSLSRFDGFILTSLFFLYLYWLFSEKKRFKKTYNNYKVPASDQFGFFLKDIGKIAAGAIVLIASAQGIVLSAMAFSREFSISLPLVGILVVSLGNCFPELYFSIMSARKGETRMILGELMGAIIIPGTLVLGVVAMLAPITIANIAMFAYARYFLLIAAIFFFLFIRTDQKITKKEALVLLSIYFIFLICEIFVK